MSDSLRPHEPPHARPPCPSPARGVYPNSCPSSWWCHPTISSSVVPSSSCLQSFPTSGSFQMSQLFSSSGRSTGVSALTSILPMNTQDRSPLGWTGWISLQSKGLSAAEILRKPPSDLVLYFHGHWLGTTTKWKFPFSSQVICQNICPIKTYPSYFDRVRECWEEKGICGEMYMWLGSCKMWFSPYDM